MTTVKKNNKYANKQASKQTAAVGSFFIFFVATIRGE